MTPLQQHQEETRKKIIELFGEKTKQLGDIVHEELSEITGQKIIGGSMKKITRTFVDSPEVLNFISQREQELWERAYGEGYENGKKSIFNQSEPMLL